MKKVNKVIANLLMAIILVTGITSVGFANTTTNEEVKNTTTTIEANEAGTGYYTIGRYRTVTHRRYLRAGDRVAITLNGDGHTNLDIYVYDAYGNLVDYRVGRTDYETMTLDIYRSETFRIKVVNRGRTYNDYKLTVYRY